MPVRISSADKVIVGHRGPSLGILVLFVKSHKVVIIEGGALTTVVDGLVIVEVEQEVVVIIRGTSSRRSPSHGGGQFRVRLSVRESDGRHAESSGRFIRDGIIDSVGGEGEKGCSLRRLADAVVSLRCAGCEGWRSGSAEGCQATKLTAVDGWDGSKQRMEAPLSRCLWFACSQWADVRSGYSRSRQQ